MVGLVLGYTARLLFDAISLGSNLAGNFMGFAAASTYDPHQESQTQVVAEIQLAIATLMFLAMLVGPSLAGITMTAVLEGRR